MKQQDPSLLEPAPRVASLPPYTIPVTNPLIDLTLHATERAVISTEMRAFSQTIDADSMVRYPDARSLEAVLAGRLGLTPQQVMVTAGADEALDRACRAMLCPGRNLVVSVPTFEMIPHFAGLAGADVRTVPWMGGPYPVEAVLQQVDATTGMIAVVTPNNPTGAMATAEDIRRLALGAPHALILVDGAYSEYADHDPTAMVLKLPNVLVARTLSKAWGLPGVRIGYALARPQVLGWMRNAGSPYSVPRPSLALAHARLQNGETDMRLHVDRVQHERRLLEQLLRSLGAEVLPSQANYVFPCFRDAGWVTDALASLGIGVRAFPRDPSLHKWRRITCPGDAEAIERLRSALVSAMQPKALLFDLDGVLADVSGSYRQAIIDTAAAFGVTISREDIAAAKAAGSANNDWALTHRLLGERGVHITIEAITECFENLYQGSEARPGLRAQETLLCEVSLLERFASKLPLAIVTGRPRRDAERFLQDQGIAGLFKHVICMEDAALKPDPAPVRVALERLGVQFAWMLGDTPDDVRAARGAGVVPIGIVAPGDTPSGVLGKSGAARILTLLTQLEEMLP